MKNKTATIIIGLMLLSPLTAFAATLTTSQINSIIGLLEAFGVNQATVTAVESALSPSAQIATSTVTVAPTAPVVTTTATTTQPTQTVAATTTTTTTTIVVPVVQPTVSTTSSPSAGSVPTVVHACQIVTHNKDGVAQTLVPPAILATTTMSLQEQCIDFPSVSAAKAEGFYFALPDDNTSALYNLYIVKGIAFPTI